MNAGQTRKVPGLKRANCVFMAMLLPFAAFTLIELLVVVAIISILASMLLPALGRGKELSRSTRCVNNLQQVMVAMAMYSHDCRDHFPNVRVYETNGTPYWTFLALGGPERPDHFCFGSPPSRLRPLYPYLKPSEVFRCTEDRGWLFNAALPPEAPVVCKPSCWEVTGCSYLYNVGSDTIRHRRDGWLTENPLGWVPDPSRFIAVYEPPVGECGVNINGIGHFVYTHWHDWRGRQDVWDDDMPRDGTKFTSPIAFVDGHVKRFDFTRNIQTNRPYIYEETRDWMWYKAKN